MNFKSRMFFLENFDHGVLGAPGCHPSTLIELANTALDSTSTVETICMILEGYRANRGVTGPMNFKKIRTIFFGISSSRDFGPTDCYPSTLIDLGNTALASKDSVETICMICKDYETHRGVTGPMKFKSKTFFFGKTCSRVFWAPGCHPSNLIDLENTALASKSSLKTICMISSGYRTHRGVTGPMNFKKSGGFFSENRARGNLWPLSVIQCL